VEDTMTYRYREEKGFIASVVIDNSTFTGHQLRALYEREFPDQDTLRAAKRFTRIALKPYLGGKPLKSRELFGSLCRNVRARNNERKTRIVMAELLLGVNIDHIATLRNARGTAYPIRFRRHLSLNRLAPTALPFICVKTVAISPTATCVFCVRRWIPA
jgi:hypothetical protein